MQKDFQGCLETEISVTIVNKAVIFHIFCCWYRILNNPGKKQTLAPPSWRVVVEHPASILGEGCSQLQSLGKALCPRALALLSAVFCNTTETVSQCKVQAHQYALHF